MAFQRERKSSDTPRDLVVTESRVSARDLLSNAVSGAATLDPAPDELDEAAAGSKVISYPAIGVAGSPLPLGGKRKRVFDLCLASIIVVLIAPLLLLIAALCKLFSPGPLLFAHRRVGFRGVEFSCLKFRTMETDAEERLGAYLLANPESAIEWANDQKLRNDPRITAIGKFLRKTSLDELPQLFNVIKGEMSLVGPRPVVADELKRYGARRIAYLAARPGISGLWQVSGRNTTSYEQRTALDENYVRTWSLGLDISIILRTLPEMLMSSRAF